MTPRPIRWLLLLLPAYGAAALGPRGWPLVSALAAGVVLYNVVMDAAARRWPDWMKGRLLFLGLVQIGLACILLSLIYAEASGAALIREFQFDGFYAIPVLFVAVAGGGRGAVLAVALATLAVAFGQVIQAPDVGSLTGPGAAEYWAAVAGYSLFYGLFFAVTGALARFALEFQTRKARSDTLLRLGRDLWHLNDAVVIADIRGRVTSMNAAAEALFGPVSEVQGRPLAAFFETPVPFETLEPLEVRVRRADGSTFDAELSLSAYRAGVGDVLARIAVVRAVSRRRQLTRLVAGKETQ